MEERRTSTRPAARPFRTLLAEHHGLEYDLFEDGRGKVRLWHHVRHFAVFESSGSISQPHAEFLIDYHGRQIEAFPRPWFTFGNWMALAAYTPDTRRLMTDWARTKRYDGLYVAHDSRVLAMSLSVANGVLENTVQILPSEEALDDMLISVRKRVGF